VIITFSSFWDCGDFQKYVLNNTRGIVDESFDSLNKFTLYSITMKGKCKDTLMSDTVAIKLTKFQSDSIFDLSNKFIDNYKLINHEKVGTIHTVVNDGTNVKVEICLENKCKSATYYSFGELKDVSPEMVKLMKYIDKIERKK
jgi:hypothetical protein